MWHVAIRMLLFTHYWHYLSIISSSKYYQLSVTTSTNVRKITESFLSYLNPITSICFQLRFYLFLSEYRIKHGKLHELLSFLSLCANSLAQFNALYFPFHFKIALYEFQLYVSVSLQFLCLAIVTILRKQRNSISTFCMLQNTFILLCNFIYSYIALTTWIQTFS